jgi:hypothetical protein
LGLDLQHLVWHQRVECTETCKQLAAALLTALPLQLQVAAGKWGALVAVLTLPQLLLAVLAVLALQLLHCMLLLQGLALLQLKVQLLLLQQLM